MTPEEQLNLYEKDTNAEKVIRDTISGAYQDLRPESELVHTYENSQFPGFYSAMSGYGAGTRATDLTPTTILQNAWGDVGRKSTTAQVARDVFDVRRAGMEDLIKSGLNQWNMGYQGAQNAWDRWWAQKQHEDQMRAARAQLNATRNIPTVGPTPEQIAAAWELKVKAGEQTQREWNAGADAARNRQLQSTTTVKPISGYSTRIEPKPANTASEYLNKLINNFRGIR